MTPEQQQIELAKLDGWTAIEDAEGFWRATRDGKMTSDLWISESNVWSVGMPDFLGDLNAVHELEKKLWLDNEEKLLNTRETYHEWQMYKHQIRYNVHARASQRCEAILRVKGIWK